MLVSINQPAYMPWLGYYDRIAASDVHIILDHVQFEKNSFTNRNKIRTMQGWAWLTVPIASKGKFGRLSIRDLRVSDGGRWKRKHWGALQASYGRSRHFHDFRDGLHEGYAGDAGNDLFLPFVLEQNRFFLHSLGIETPVRRSSQMSITGTKSDLVLDICKKVGATAYLSGPLGWDYLDMDSFRQAGIQVFFHDYVHPVYAQLHPGFEPYMAVADVLFNHGEKALDIIRSGYAVTEARAVKD